MMSVCPFWYNLSQFSLRNRRCSLCVSLLLCPQMLSHVKAFKSLLVQGTSFFLTEKDPNKSSRWDCSETITTGPSLSLLTWFSPDGPARGEHASRRSRPETVSGSTGLAPRGEQPEAAAGGRQEQDWRPWEGAGREAEADCWARGKAEGKRRMIAAMLKWIENANHANSELKLLCIPAIWRCKYKPCSVVYR